ncbi:hypothetical protein C8R45DRAFT_946863 [Mycena sanguinolenta]|nr:hypothetical protein C8R45DRAFT_946863 [Mycena sanguinolenta]
MGHGKISASDGVDLDIIIYTLRFNDRAFQKKGTSDDEEQDNAGDRKWLAADIKKWHQQQDICPQVTPLVVAEPYTSPELDKLFLPSDFTSAERAKQGLKALGAEELKLGQGQANDALRSLHKHIQHSQALRQHKNACNNAIWGQAKNTYPKFGFPEPKDLYTKRVDEPHNVGDGAKTEGWIWRQGYYRNWTNEEAKYVQDSAKVQWDRARADMERWQEELELVGQEFCCAVQGFNKMHSVWTVASIYEQMEKNMRQ